MMTIANWRQARRPARIAGEMALLFGTLALIDRWLTGGTGFEAVQPNPYWLPVVAMAVAYGAGTGLVAAGLASALWLAAPHAPLAVGGDAFARLLGLSLPPMLWVLAAVSIGEITALRTRAIRSLTSRSATFERNCHTMIGAYRTLAGHNRNLQVRMALEERSVAQALHIAAGLREPHPAGPWQTVARLISHDTRCEDFSLYVETDGWWHRAAHGDAASDRAESAAPALVAAAARLDRAMHVANAGDREALGDAAIAAVALREAAGEPVIGLIVWHALPIERLTRHGIIDLSATAAWVGAIVASERRRMVRSQPAALRVVGSDVVP